MSAVVAAAPLASVAAETQKSIQPAGAAHRHHVGGGLERRYQVQNGVAQVQDFYYPSLKKYSDPYQVAAAQIRKFCPRCKTARSLYGISTARKKSPAAIKTASPTANGPTGMPTASESAVMPYVNGQAKAWARAYRNGNEGVKSSLKTTKPMALGSDGMPDGSPKTEMTWSTTRR